jgi:hypothetical protein
VFRDLILLRSTIASIVPVSLYSVGFLTAKLAGIKTGLFFAAYPWIGIGIISVLWPINKLPLWMFFESVDFFLTR